MKKIVFIFGTRPEAIKMCPVIREFKKHEEVETIVLVTGQHREMLKQVLDVFDIVPDYDLAIMKEDQDLFDITREAMNGVRNVLQEVQPDLVMVHGDTTTSFASALSAFYLGIRIGHVEAGLRTYDIHSPYPEEFNRVAVDALSDLMFAPTEHAKENLIREGRGLDKIFVTGNTVIDALKLTYIKDFRHPVLEWATGYRLILLTLHRREAQGMRMIQMMEVIRNVIDMHEDCKLVFSMHKNSKIRNMAFSVFGEHARIRLIEPLDLVNFHNLMRRSYLILTDSGGIQEEAPSMGVPVLVLRNDTERPEGVNAGAIRVVGTERDKLFHSFNDLLENRKEYEKMVGAVNLYGDGSASQNIWKIIDDDSLRIFSEE